MTNVDQLWTNTWPKATTHGCDLADDGEIWAEVFQSWAGVGPILAELDQPRSNIDPNWASLARLGPASVNFGRRGESVMRTRKCNAL